MDLYSPFSAILTIEDIGEDIESLREIPYAFGIIIAIALVQKLEESPESATAISAAIERLLENPSPVVQNVVELCIIDTIFKDDMARERLLASARNQTECLIKKILTRNAMFSLINQVALLCPEWPPENAIHKLVNDPQSREIIKDMHFTCDSDHIYDPWGREVQLSYRMQEQYKIVSMRVQAVDGLDEIDEAWPI